MKINIGISPCPNDTFIFFGLLSGKIDTCGIEFTPVITDVEKLNQHALRGDLEITKLSYHVFYKVVEKYCILNSGSAIGHANGPILVSKRKIYPDEIPQVSIAIPGVNTTANLLLSLAWPNAKKRKEYLFSDIEDAVLSEEQEAGILIHEKRFTYAERGLKKIIDLGELWEQQSGLPIPLGGIAASRNIDKKTLQSIQEMIRKSIEYAYKNSEPCMAFIKQYSDEKNNDIIHKHIDLFVNNYSLDMGNEGRKAVTELYKQSCKKGLIENYREDIFIN